VSDSKQTRALARTSGLPEKGECRTEVTLRWFSRKLSHALFQNAPPEDFHVRIATTPEEITQLLEADFEYVLQKDGLAYFRKRK
jgi:hypothetical protein